MLTTDMAMDQAAGLRRMASNRPVRVIAVTSGKGGVGKTNVSVNMAVALARANNDVLLMDADLGLANVDVMLGLHPTHNLQHVIEGTHTLDDILVEGPAGIQIIPASSGTQRMAELTCNEHAGLIRAFSEMVTSTDVLIVDTAAGISDGVISFARAAQELVVVVCDEPTSITDAYALIKLLSRDYGVNRFRVVANMVGDLREGRELFLKLTKVTDRFLDVMLDFVGAVPFDPYVRKAVKKQAAVSQAFPSSPAAQAFAKLSQQVLKWPVSAQSSGQLGFFVERLIEYSNGSVGA